MARNYTLHAPKSAIQRVLETANETTKTTSSISIYGGSLVKTQSSGAGRFHKALIINGKASGCSDEHPAGLVICAISAQTPESKAKEKLDELSKRTFLDFCFEQAPVVGFRKMKSDIVTVREARFPDELTARLDAAGPRGDIEELSTKSRRRLAIVAANTEAVFRSFITVSYPASFPCDGKVVKRHLKCLLMALRRFCPDKLEYLWFLEFQKRGAPHIHMFLTHALSEPLSVMRRTAGRVNKECRVHWPSQDWLSDTWFDIVDSGDEKHRLAGAAWEVVEKPDGAARYVAKESYKVYQKAVPKEFQNVGRFWATSRGLTPDEGEFVRCSVDQMRKFLPAGSFDEAGNPYPVIFGAADEYEKIRDTAKDPARIAVWNRQRIGKNIPLDLKLNGLIS